MHFSENSGSIRVDRFKESGKWYDYQAIDMTEYYNEPMIHDGLKKAINGHHGNESYVDSWLAQGGFFVCLEPYHRHAHPIVLK